MLNASDIDEAKENLRPIKQGRDVTALANSLQLANKTHSAMQKDTTNQILGFEESIKNCSGDDISIWRAYVKWLQQNCPTDCKRVKLLDVLERAVMQFIADNNFKNDDRYIALWLDYCSMLTDSTHIFKYLWNCKIGVERAMLYAGWAASLEERHQFTQAFEVYSLGVAKKVEPLEQLKCRFERFQKRMQFRFHDHVGRDDLLAKMDSEKKRPIMNPLSGHEASSRVRPTDQRLLPPQAQNVFNKNKSQQEAQKDSTFEVFEDNEESSGSSFFDNSTNWPTQFPGGYLKVASENTNRAIKKWDKVRIKQKPVRAEPADTTCCFTVYTDPDVLSPPPEDSECAQAQNCKPQLSKMGHKVLNYFSTLDLRPGECVKGSDKNKSKEKEEKEKVKRKMGYDYTAVRVGPAVHVETEFQADEVEAAKPIGDASEWSFEELHAFHWLQANPRTVDSSNTPVYPISEDSDLNSFWLEGESAFGHDMNFEQEGNVSKTVFNDASRLFDSDLTVFQPQHKPVSNLHKQMQKLQVNDTSQDEFEVFDDFANKGLSNEIEVFDEFAGSNLIPNDAVEVLDDFALKSGEEFLVYNEFPDDHPKEPDGSKCLDFEVYEEPQSQPKPTKKRNPFTTKFCVEDEDTMRQRLEAESGK
eukprot:Platyproteum_vivax@DN4696_c0_g1_i1.p1